MPGVFRTTTTTIKVAGLTITGTNSVSRNDSTMENSVTTSGSHSSTGVMPESNLGVGIAVNSKGFVTFSASFDGSKKVGGQTFTAGVSGAINGNNKGSNSTTSGTFGASVSGTFGAHTYSSSITVKTPW